MLSAFLGGMILNFMPCVFPVLSLKAAGLVRHSHDRGHARAEGLAFMGGVLVTLLALAGVLIAARTGGAAIGWGFQLQSPVVIALLVLVMLGAALNLAGQFEIGMSLQGVGHGAGAKGGLVGSALTGALAIIVATPCTAPFMAGALGYALVQPPLVALAIFAALGVGFALPFTALAMSPGAARVLPKPGPWMDTLKHFLAFPMLGAAAWLVWVLSQQAGQAGLAIILAACVMLAFAGWMFGIAQRRRMSGRRSSLAHVMAGAGLAVALIGAVAVGKAPQTRSVIAATDRPAQIDRRAWSPAQVATARSEGKPILVDFTASWCITCQVNDRTTLSTKAVKDALTETGTVYMVADSTNYNAAIEQALSDFGRSGLPLYVVYPADGGKPVILPQILTPSLVIDALRKARGAA